MKVLSKIAAVSFILWFGVRSQAQNSIPVRDIKVDVGGYRLQFHEVAGKSPAIVFESGGGDDSSVWRDIVPLIARKTRAQLITYDRAGFGQSDSNPAPYSIIQDVEALEEALRQLHVNGGVIPVAHSYGGFLATLLAARNPSKVKGLVLIDANLAPFFTDAVIDGLMGGMPEMLEQVKKQDPQRAAALARMLNPFSQTVKTMLKTTLPTNLSITDIVSEKTPVQPPNDVAWIRVHQEFDKAAPNRRGIMATGSGHYIMRAKPELVIDEIAAMFEKAQ